MHQEMLKPEQRKIFEKVRKFSEGKRMTLKDYVDLYFILKKRIISLREIIKGCEKKYKKEFNGRLFLEQLISVEEAEEVKIEFLGQSVSRKEMQEFFEKEVDKINI
jgi:hypothetical protein